MMWWEVEQKFRVSRQEIERGLIELGIQLAAPVGQIDHYFNHPARDFGATDEAFRLRQVGDKNFVTYKGPKVDPETKTRQELELPLAAGSDVAGQFADLFHALGFRSVGTVRKQRQCGSIAWKDQLVEVALDEVENVGSFLELEISSDDEGVSAAKTAVSDIAGRLGLTNSDRRSYLEMLLAKDDCVR